MCTKFARVLNALFPMTLHSASTLCAIGLYKRTYVQKYYKVLGRKWSQPMSVLKFCNAFDNACAFVYIFCHFFAISVL